MAQLYKPLDPNQIDPTDKFGTLPAGEHRMHLVQDEWKENANGGSRLQMEFDIIDGQFRGRKFFTSLNLQHSNLDAVEIAERHFSQLCHAVGYLSQVQDTAVLYHKPVLVKIGLRPAGPDKNGVHREESNELKSFKPDPAYQTGGGQAGNQPQNHNQAGNQPQNHGQAGGQPGGGGQAPWRQ